jgi:chemotaxis protein MotA
MDLLSIIGFIAGIGCVLYGYTMDGGHIASLGMASSALIVFGGSFGALFLSYGMKQVKTIPKLLLEIFKAPKSTINETIEYLVKLSQTAKENGLLSLEKAVSDSNVDPFIKRGILSVVDGTDPEKISETMQSEIYVYEQDKILSISMLDALGGYGPAFGMVGTIVGMIHVLSAGSSDASELIKAIGVAFTATLYGVASANLIFLPMATKLKGRLSIYRLEKEMIIEAVCAIRNGVNPKMLQEQLSSYLILGSKSNKGK